MLKIAASIFLLALAKNAFAVSQINIQIGTLSNETIEVRNASIALDLKSTPTVAFKTELKQPADKAFSQAQLRCQVPALLLQATWSCSEGKFVAERINLPFALDITPQPKGFVANLNLLGANFSDEAGLHAAEKLTGYLTVVAKQEGDALHFNSALNWQSGEMFWQPLYIANGGHELQATGNLKGDILTLDSATLKLSKVGNLSFNGQIGIKQYQVIKLNADLPNLNLAEAYPLLFKPFLGKTMLNNAELNGKAALSIKVENSQLKTFNIQLKEVNIDDKNHKFAFYNVNADIPWSYDDATNVALSYLNGQLLSMPLGRTSIGAQVNRYSLVSPNITLPILDGELKLSDISAARIGSNWYWHLRANLSPVSMSDATRAFKLPIMQGKASAEIPLVTYSGGILTTEGEMVLNVFDGTAKVSQLTMINPLSQSPQLSADLTLRN